MALTSFRFEASFPADPEFLETLGTLVHDVVVYAGCSAADAKAVAAEVRAALGPALAGSGGGPVVLDFMKRDGLLGLQIVGPHTTLRIVKPAPSS